MSEIICPHCKKPFVIDENDYAAIVRQVHDSEFDKALQERLAQLSASKDAEFHARELERDAAFKEQLAQKDSLIAQKEHDAKAFEQQVLADQRQAELQKNIEVEQALAQSKEALAQLEAEKRALDEQLLGIKKQARTEQELALAQVKDEYAQELAETRSALQSAQDKLAVHQVQANADKELALVQARESYAQELSNAQAELKSLQDKLEVQRSAAETEKQLALERMQRETEASCRELREETQKAQQELVLLKAQAEQEMALVQAKAQTDQATSQQEFAIKLQAKQDEISERDRTIETLRLMRREFSTKRLGENLEQYCENEFNKLRPTAFQQAEFGKDNDASSGTKGDYIYRERDEAGNEIVSIMFEMKTEAEDSEDKNRKRNEDHFKKLDHDRRVKKCEYAVLVSELEMDNDLYEGITDVSYQSGYEKMYVIRPKSFIALISLIRNASMKSLALRHELEAVKQRDLDVTHFEERLDDFRNVFGMSCKHANDNFQKAIKDIDDTIKKLERIRDELRKSGNHLDAAENKLGKLTRKSLCYKNETVREAFKAYDKKLAAGLVEPYVPVTVTAEDEQDIIEAQLIDED